MCRVLFLAIFAALFAFPAEASTCGEGRGDIRNRGSSIDACAVCLGAKGKLIYDPKDNHLGGHSGFTKCVNKQSGHRPASRYDRKRPKRGRPVNDRSDEL
ncbi:hypothetical protein DIPPA_27943 [Diplonema papillatum]|nr:hypothetical protein DIPPA_27943 [Diplonema papillatum]